VDTLPPVKSPDELTRIFRSQGLKVTPQRQSIFRALHGSTTHPTAEAVYETVSREMPTISLRTVYQTLNDLTQMGEIMAFDLGTGSVRFDPHIGQHHHLVCESCGKVQDVDADFPGVAPPANRFGFEVSSTEIVFRGRCRDCAGVATGDGAA
jgi:Fur family peroxide stress response transcriptional regulator